MKAVEGKFKESLPALESCRDSHLERITEMITTAANTTSFDLFCQVSHEDLDRAERVTNMQTHKDFYIIRDDTTEALVEYQVHDLKNCTCGKERCEHIAIAKAADLEHHLMLAVLSTKQAKQNLKTAKAEEDREQADYALFEARAVIFSLLVEQDPSFANWEPIVQKAAIDNLLFAEDCFCSVCGKPATDTDLENLDFRCKEHLGLVIA